MGNYKVYFFFSAVAGLLVLALLIGAVAVHPGVLIWVGVLQIPLGLMQLIVGIDLWARRAKYPDWVQKGLKAYWTFTLVYFLILAVIWQFEPAHMTLVGIWLFIVPWSIAIYQFVLIYRMAGLRKRQYEKRELLQLYNH